MSELKHTPGPWRWEDGNLRADNNDFIVWPQNVMGGNAPKTWADFLGSCGEHSEDAAEANARLIAAAPEMLDALVELKEWIENDCGAECPSDKAVNAIEKATGSKNT